MAVRRRDNGFRRAGLFIFLGGGAAFLAAQWSGGWVAWLMLAVGAMLLVAEVVYTFIEGKRYRERKD